MIRMKLMDETDNICVPAGTLLFWEISQSKVGMDDMEERHVLVHTYKDLLVVGK